MPPRRLKLTFGKTKPRDQITGDHNAAPMATESRSVDMEDHGDASPVQLVGDQPEQPPEQQLPPPVETVANGTTGMDIDMKEEPTDHTADQAQTLPADGTSPQPPTSATPQPSIPAPTATTPARSSPHPSQTFASATPTQPYPHGSPTRVYLNQHVTPHLLEAMKLLATQEPEKPLKFLADFLAERSREIEGA